MGCWRSYGEVFELQAPRHAFFERFPLRLLRLVGRLPPLVVVVVGGGLLVGLLLDKRVAVQITLVVVGGVGGGGGLLVDLLLDQRVAVRSLTSLLAALLGAHVHGAL